ncbi:MAG TPA: hypothetical protein DCW52_09890 [Gammaproteobacteria bacterium]|jgi:hypothetical protein|nr:hypothetical protein [Gammaproteobacteria bacterium]
MYHFMEDVKHQQKHHDNSTIEAKAKLIALCTQNLGGFYQANDTIESCAHPTTDHIVKIHITDANLVERTHMRMRYKEMQRQMNLESILDQVRKRMSGSAPQQGVDNDWANLFFDFAEDISDPAMQSIWANAMVHELYRPNSISKCSLKFLHSLDNWEIKAFKKVAASAFIGKNGHPFVFRSVDNPLESDPLFSQTRMLSHCIAAGLINKGTRPLSVGFSFNYQGEDQVVSSGHLPEGTSVGYYIQSFTKIGSDLYRMVIKQPKQAVNDSRHEVWELLSDFLELGQCA